jgi:hypothetical protein
MVSSLGARSILYTEGMQTPRAGRSPIPVQLTLSFVSEPPPPGFEGHRLTRTLMEHPSRSRILRMVRIALGYFPELEGTGIKIGIARGAQGYASLDEPAIWLNPRGLCYQTIAHELVHLLQARGLVPGGERSCDLYSLARDRFLVDAAPVYLAIPDALTTPRGGLRGGAARLLFATAREAIRRREAGERRYIRWFETALASAPLASAVDPSR